MTGLDGSPPPTTATERTPLFEQLWREAAGHHPHYHRNQHPEEETMSLATIEKDMRDAVTGIEEHVKSFLGEHLPQLGEIAKSVEESPLVQLALDLAGTIDPAAEQMAVKVLQALASEAPAPATPPAGPAPEPAPAQPAA